MKTAKLTPDQLETLERLKITGKTEAEVREELVAKLKELDVEDVQNDPIEDLISIYAAFSEIEPEKVEKPKKAAPAPTKPKAKVVEEQDEDDEEKDEKIFDSPSKESDDEDEEEEDEIDNSKLKVAKKPVAKAPVAKKPTGKKIAPDSDDDLKALTKEAKAKSTEDKAAKAAAAKDKPSDNKKNFVDFTANEDEKKLAEKTLVALFKKRGYFVKFGKKIISFSIKDTVSGRCLFTLDDLKLNSDGTFNIWLGFNAFRLLKNEGKDLETIKSFLDPDLAERVTVYSSGLCYAKSVTDAELKSFLPDALLDFMESYIGKLDKKLNQNRKKMEESIAGTPATK